MPCIEMVKPGSSKASIPLEAAAPSAVPMLRYIRKKSGHLKQSIPGSPQVNLKRPQKRAAFVKINMDGISMCRKMDVNAVDSYKILSLAIDKLFCGLIPAQQYPLAAGSRECPQEEVAISGLLYGTDEYTLVYEDYEGDRMMVGDDVPWGPRLMNSYPYLEQVIQLQSIALPWTRFFATSCHIWRYGKGRSSWFQRVQPLPTRIPEHYLPDHQRPQSTLTYWSTLGSFAMRMGICHSGISSLHRSIPGVNFHHLTHLGAYL